MGRIRDPSLSERGRRQIEWAERHMPVLLRIRSRFARETPLEGVKIGACLHVTKETAALVRTLEAGGAEVCLAASNPLSTQDDVAAALSEGGTDVYAWRGQTEEEYRWAIDMVIRSGPNVTMDDGGDLTVAIHEAGAAEGVWGGTEETTTGVIRIRALEREGRLAYPVVAVNNAATKWDFDNVYGTGQSALDGIIRATNILLAGKRVVVAGYGHVGRGIAARARGMGARVIVTEVDPVQALRAVMDGYDVMPMSEAARVGDVFVTATGNVDVLRGEHFAVMRDGAVLANAGHFDVEISVGEIREAAREVRRVRPNLEEYVMPDGRRIYLLAEGRLVNLVAAEGHPSEVMDISFANQALAVERLVAERGRLQPRVIGVPPEVDREIASLKLESMGISIDKLSPEQEAYLRSWR